MALLCCSAAIVDNWGLLPLEKEAELGAALPVDLLPARRQGLHGGASSGAARRRPVAILVLGGRALTHFCPAKV